MYKDNRVCVSEYRKIIFVGSNNEKKLIMGTF